MVFAAAMTEIVRTPLEPGVRLRARRSVEERLMVRWPRAYAALAGALFRRVPPRSWLRRLLVRRAALSGWSAWARGDLDVMLVRYAPDCQFDVPPEFVGAGMRTSYHGHAGAREEAADLREAYEQADITPHEIVDAGDRLVILGRIHIRARGSGVELESEQGVAYWIERGLCARERAFFDWGAALRAADIPVSSVDLDHSRRAAAARTSDGIVRWEVEPLRRSGRGLDEWLFLVLPWMLRPLVSGAARARPGSLLRRALIGRLVCQGLAAVNRGDYALLSAGLSTEVEIQLLPDAPDARPADVEPVYRGIAGYLQVAEIWKADFDEIRFELRELIDPGGDRIAARGERVGHGGRSGVEVRDTDFYVWQFESGKLRRQWILRSETAMLATLNGLDNAASQGTATDPPA